MQTLLEYQEQAVTDLINCPRIILDGAAGSGKTAITIKGKLDRIIKSGEHILILCSANALYTWQKEPVKWLPDYLIEKSVLIKGTRNQRRLIIGSSSKQIFITTYKAFMMDFDCIKLQNWGLVICDEFQKSGILNKQTDTFKALNVLCNGGQLQKYSSKKTIKEACLISATVVKKGPQDLWAPLNILAPKIFPSYWKFVEKYCLMVETMFGKTIAGPKNTAELKEAIRPYYHRIPRKITDAQLPPMRRTKVLVDMNRTQLVMYNRLRKENTLDLVDTSLIATCTTISLFTRLKQLLTCPLIVDPDCLDVGAAIMNVADMIKELEDTRAVIFVSFKSAIPYYIEYLKTQFPDTYIDYMCGGISTLDIKLKTEKFRAEGGIIICTIQFSQSFELETAKHCWFISASPDVGDNEQAEGRLRRLSSDKNPLIAYYMHHVNPESDITIDDIILTLLSVKNSNIKETYKEFENV